jgi:hypothetical protein
VSANDLHIEGVARVADFLSDLLVYRKLEPADRRVPGLMALAPRLGLAGLGLPRKSDAAYARVVLEVLRSARALEASGVALQQLIYIGDSPGLDVTAFRNLVQESGWRGWVFIGLDNLAEPPVLRPDGNLCRGNRWSMLPEFLRWAANDGAVLDASLAVVVDLDKTMLGPRGRNDRAIDDARMDAALHVAGRAVGDEFQTEAFTKIYKELNQSKYHRFTGDNQDFVVYISITIAAGLYPMDALLQDLAAGRVATFTDFLDAMDVRVAGAGLTGLQVIHAEVAGNFRAGDPTPFKSFRREEYLTTTGRMSSDVGVLLPLAAVLAQRLTINYEVAQVLSYLRGRGALALGLSDKPDEAVFPTPELVARGHPPLHRAQTLLVGERLNLALSS